MSLSQPPSELRARLVLHSVNSKVGGIPVSMSSRSTCPPSCAWYNNGCYAENHLVGLQWRRLDKGEGLSWKEFLLAVRALPDGQLWRHNEAGDLPGVGDSIDAGKLCQLYEAAAHTKMFTYTHKPVLGSAGEHNNTSIRSVVSSNFVINLSADSLDHADDLCRLHTAPVTVVLPESSPASLRTPGGRRVEVCPAILWPSVTCSSCGLCARYTRSVIVGFIAHGCKRRRVTRDLVQLKLFK